MFINRFIFAFKRKSKETLTAWTYQCESIFSQRARRVQQLVSFYQSVYGTQGLKQLWRSYYRRELHPPLHDFMISAVGIIGLSLRQVQNDEFDWSKERLSLRNFDICSKDIEFIDSINSNELCENCKAKNMKYCYCKLGNKRCAPSEGEEPTIKGCQKTIALATSEDIPEGFVELETQENKTWEPYFSKNEFSIWRREEETTLYSYKVYARFDDITADDFLHVQTDIDYRRQWDDTAVHLEMISEDPTPGSHSHLIYWEMRWPKFFANRDYVYCRRYVKDDPTNLILICSRSAKHQDYPIFSGKVRCTNYWSLMVIKPYHNFSEPGLHFVLTYFDDPGIAIPQHIKSWVTQKQMPEFLTKMYMATKNYSYTRAMDMKDLFNSFTLIDNDYARNGTRANWITTLAKQHQPKRKIFSFDKSDN